jgi:hypothetical protein
VHEELREEGEREGEWVHSTRVGAGIMPLHISQFFYEPYIIHAQKKLKYRAK